MRPKLAGDQTMASHVVRAGVAVCSSEPAHLHLLIAIARSSHSYSGDGFRHGRAGGSSRPLSWEHRRSTGSEVPYACAPFLPCRGPRWRREGGRPFRRLCRPSVTFMPCSRYSLRSILPEFNPLPHWAGCRTRTVCVACEPASVRHKPGPILFLP